MKNRLRRRETSQILTPLIEPVSVTILGKRDPVPRIAPYKLFQLVWNQIPHARGELNAVAVWDGGSCENGVEDLQEDRAELSVRRSVGD